MTRRYTIHVTDGNRCTAIMIDKSESYENIQYDLLSQFKSGCEEKITEEKK